MSTFERTHPAPLLPLLYEPMVRRALEEDLGRAGDLTTDSVVPPGATARAALVTRQLGCVAGLEVGLSAFTMLDPSISITRTTRDGHMVAPGDSLAVIVGAARTILSGERVCLNLLGRLCGIATTARAAVEAVRGTHARITGTRKTTPGLRIVEKYAKRVGGALNHRFGLDDGVLIKDNHIVAAGGLKPAVLRARAAAGHMVKIEVEVDTLEQLDEALTLPIDAVLLDNMPPDMLREAVRRVDGRVITEASGGITPDTVAEVAATGVDMISLGWLTHSVPVLDIGLDFDPTGTRKPPSGLD
ncbi:MAG: carboxylating nicotinate-nucleotide diphosphorylase [Alphaproteobacteria bacterium]|jgi:nicotinate-nucleotide pyrophosphorylase (carboxylating)|nr:carboxylating nicotinate-nucleotide diphosphorylase [Alphaproteobacteria bacterium]